jgi:hypothetical protein
VADPAQAIYVKPWQAPADMVELPLVYNLRNCLAIARLVEKLGGPAPAFRPRRANCSTSTPAARGSAQARA